MMLLARVQRAAPAEVPWPASTIVARAYLDQLGRSKGIRPERAQALTTALDRADEIRTGQEKGAPAIVEQLNTLAGQLESARARPADAMPRRCGRSRTR